MIKKHLIYLVSGFLLLTLPVACVRDSGVTECASYVRFVYDYNMAFEDLFHNQACKMDLYLFDDDGIFIDVLSQEMPGDDTFPRDFQMRLPDDLTYPVHMVAWSGLHEECYHHTVLTKNVSTLHDLMVRINDTPENINDAPLRDLWHGVASKLDNNLYETDYTTIHLTKNTNRIRIVLQCVDEDEEFDVNDFSFSLSSANGSYNHLNATEQSEPFLTYRPCYTENDIHSGAIAEIHTLRLLEDRENRLIIEHIPQEEPLIDINLNYYINSLKMSEYHWMPMQEYMDREDEYRVIILVKSIPGENGGVTYIIINITINEWYVRDQQE